jgi:hypothetical protein
MVNIEVETVGRLKDVVVLELDSGVLEDIRFIDVGLGKEAADHVPLPSR